MSGDQEDPLHYQEPRFHGPAKRNNLLSTDIDMINTQGSTLSKVEKKKKNREMTTKRCLKA